jgi:hypothetical protein
VVYTALPILFVAVMDQVIPARVLENNVDIYRNAKGSAISANKFMRWIFRAFCHSVVAFGVPILAMGEQNVVTKDGYTHGMRVRVLWPDA